LLRTPIDKDETNSEKADARTAADPLQQAETSELKEKATHIARKIDPKKYLSIPRRAPLTIRSDWN